MNNHLIKLAGLLGFALTLTFLTPRQAAADDDDPPGRVARLSFTHGPVSFEPGGADEWVDARINRPMTTGDRLWSDSGALAEMNTGSAYIRLGSNTGFSFLNLSDNATQIQLTEGTLLARVRRLDQDETFEIDTPNLAFSIYQAGTYKITVNEAGDVTVVQVRRGEGEVTGGGAAYSLHEGDEGRFAGIDGLVANFDNYQYRPDAFENWSALRDRRIDHSYSSKYVSPDVIGYEDLDQYGGWRPTGEYGNVWFPHTTEVGWAPYHNGHWAYIAPWGYTWVDDEPWGFAPFHYGRWINVEGSWGWVPGPRESEGGVYVRPVYAPALVAWVGGPHFSIGISVGGGGGRYSEGESVGWFPLGPREVYVPSYPVSRTYVNNVNVSNTNVNTTVVNNYYNTTVVNNTNNSTNVNVTNVKYVNQTVPGAVTATTPQAFVSAQSVAKNVVQVNQREIAAAPVRIAAPPVAPVKGAVLGNAAPAPAKPPEAVVNRTVVAKAAPPPPPVPFVQQQKAIEANGGKPLPVSEIRQMRVQEQQQVQRGQQQQQQQQRMQPGQPPPPAQQAQQAHPAVRIAPPAQPQNARPAQAQDNAGNRPAATPNNQQQPNNRPPNQNTQQQPPPQQPQPANRSAQPESAPPNRPNNPNPPPQQTNRPEQQQNNNPNRPNIPNNPPNRAPVPDPALEQKHQQELELLHKQQDQERQRVEQQHQQELKLQEQKAAEELRQKQQQAQQQAQKLADQQQQERKLQEQRAADQQRQQQQQAQRNADQQQQQQQERKLQEQRAAEQQRQQQLEQAQRNVEQQRQQKLQEAQRAADQQRQQIEQKHQEELRQLEQKHAQEQQQLNQKHEQEHQQQQQQQQRPLPPPPQQQPPPPPQKQPPAPKDKEKPKQDRPPQRG
jgi:hypothetical protein